MTSKLNKLITLGYHFPRSWGLTLAIVAACAASACQSKGPESSAEAETFVLIDSKSGEIFRAPQGTGIPATNPKTHKKSLVNAMFCEKCARWYPVPPLDVLQRTPRARLCPKTGNPLNPVGPIPDSAADLAAVR